MLNRNRVASREERGYGKKNEARRLWPILICINGVYRTRVRLSPSLSLGYRSSMLMRDKGRARLTAATLLANPYKIPLVRAVTEMRGDEGLNCARQGCRDFLGDHACRGGHAADDRADTCAQAFHGTVMLELEYLCGLRTFLVKNDGFPVLL